MNPLVSTQCARRLFMTLAAIAGIFFTAGCGSSSSPTPNQGGFGPSDLNGTYVFSSAGADSNGNFLTLAGAFTANGQGGLGGGTMDVVDSGFTSLPSPVAQTITAGSYTVGTDGRGQVTLTSSAGTFNLVFVLTSVANGVSSHGLISEFDNNGTGSGTLDLQTAVTNVSQLQGPYAFNLSGIDSSLNSFAATGAFTLDSNGDIVTGTGIEDFNAGGFPYLAQTLTGGVSAVGSGTGPGSINLTTPSFATFTFDFYPIDPTHWKLIETDFIQTGDILVGDAFTQTGASSIPTGPMVFTMAGGTTGPIVDGGLMNSEGSGNFSNGLEDENAAGLVSPAQIPFTGNAAGPAGIGGRVLVNLSGFSPALEWVIYPSSGGLLLLEMDSVTVTQGVAYAQSATSFTSGNSVGYGLNLTGVNSGGFEIDDIAQFDALSATTNNMTGVLQENDEGDVLRPTSLTGTYTPDSPATGRGSIVVPSIGTALGGLSLEYYVVDGSTVLCIEGDTQQVSAGMFGLQSSAQSQAVLSRVSIVHPAVRVHGALRRK